MRIVLCFGERLVKAVKPRRVTPEITEVDCIECGGDGDWGKFLFLGANAADYAETFGVELPYKRGTFKCVDCKGTGRVYV